MYLTKKLVPFSQKIFAFYLFTISLRKSFFLALFLFFTQANTAKAQAIIGDSLGFQVADANNSISALSNFPLNSSVKAFVDAYLLKNGANLLQLKRIKKDVLNLYSKVFVANNLPAELMYVSVVESNLNTNARSRAGALGAWQIMPDEAKKYGLLKRGMDDRKNYEKSTIVAAKLFTHLYDVFGDWLLVVAAYNCGEGRMKKVIRKAGSNDFWELQPFLPKETRQHVKKFIATHLIMQNSLSEVALSNKELVAYNLNRNTKTDKTSFNGEVVAIKLTEQIDVTELAAALAIPVIQLLENNPHLSTPKDGKTNYSLLLPKDKELLFLKMRTIILQKSKDKMYATPIITADKAAKTKA